MEVPIQVINDMFFIHPHMDDYADLHYHYAFAPWMLRWKPLRVQGGLRKRPIGADGRARPICAAPAGAAKVSIEDPAAPPGG